MTYQPHTSLLTLALFTLLSYGCANQSVDTTSAETQAPATTNNQRPTSDANSASEPAAATVTKIPEKPEYPIRPFETDTLYDLLVGELAGIRNQLGVAEEKYLAQARATQDPGVIARAAQIAAYMENQPAMLEMSQLWIAVEPDSVEANSLAALSLSRNNRYQDAFEYALFALKKGEKYPLLNLTVSANRANSEQRAALLQRYPALEAQMPNNTDLLLTKAMLQRQQKLLPEALATVNKLLTKDSSMQPAIMLKAQLLYQSGKKADTAAFLKQSLVNQPNNKRMRLQYARFLADDDLEAAHKQLSILYQRYPNDPELIYSLALASKGLNRQQETIELFTQLTRYPRTAYSAHFELGLLAEQRNDVTAVLTHYRQVLSGPKLLPAAVRLTQFMADHDQLDDARLYLQKLRLDNPRKASPLYQIEAELLAEQELLAEAYDVLSQAVLREPKNIKLLYTRSLLSERQNDFVRSEQDLRAILQQDADNAMALNALGYTLTLHTDRYKEAHELILRALELNPGDPATIDSLGWVSYRLGKYDEAIKLLREALSKLPDPEVAAHLGEVLWVTGEQGEAMDIWQKILTDHPDNPLILETIERLTQGEPQSNEKSREPNQ